MVSKVEINIPPTTEIPMAIRPLAPSPVAKANGTRPRIVDTLVIKIGRKRWMDALQVDIKIGIWGLRIQNPKGEGG